MSAPIKLNFPFCKRKPLFDALLNVYQTDVKKRTTYNLFSAQLIEHWYRYCTAWGLNPHSHSPQICLSTLLLKRFVATLTITRFESSRMSKNERILYVVPFDFCDPTCRLRVKCLLQKHDPWAEKQIRMLQVNDLCLYTFT